MRKILGSTDGSLKKLSARKYANDEQELVAKYLALAIARSIKSPDLKKIIKEKIGQKFDGDFNVRWDDIKSSGATDKKVRDLIIDQFDSTISSELIEDIFNNFPKLQIAIPVNFELWDGKSDLLVTYVPLSINDLDIEEVVAYDSKLKEHKLSGKEPPKFPVIVISRNERTDDGGNLISKRSDMVQVESIITPSSLPVEVPAKTGYPTTKNEPLITQALSKRSIYSTTPKVPLNWSKIKVTSDLEGWLMGGMEVRLHLLSDKEVHMTAMKEGVYEDNNYNVNAFLRYINEDISRYIGVRVTEIDDNDWDKNFKLILSADVAKQFKGTDANGNAKANIEYTFGADTDDDYVGENNKIELASQNVSTTWTAGYGRILFNYDPGVVEYDVSSMPFFSASTNSGRGNQWNVEYGDGGSVSDGEDVTYRLIVPQGETHTYKMSTCNEVTNFDTMIQIFDNAVMTPYMNDDDLSCPNNYRHSTLTAQLSGGTYYVVVDGYIGYVGSYKLSIEKI